MKKSQLFTIYLLFFIFGILIANFFDFNFDIFYLFVLLLCFIILPIVFYKNKKVRLIILGLSFLFLGIWRFGISIPVINQSHIGYYNGSQVKFIGQVVDEEDIRDKHRKLNLGKIEMVGNKRLKGKILVNAPNYPEYGYGDWLKVGCEIEEPGEIENFDYGKFLGVKGIQSVCYIPNKLEKVDGKISAGQKFRLQILKVKYRYRRIIDQSMSYPESEILSAMVLGLRRGIPKNILDNFRASGLSHIIAISGLHISIVTLLLINLFIAIGFKRRYAFWLAIISLILFLIMIGFRASSIRAGIMGLTALVALQTGRLNKSINILLLAAGILLLINPKLLLDDVGFQLSFLAVAGIIYLGKYVNKFLSKLRVPEWLEIRSSLQMTLSAQIMVLPLIVYYFGNLSLIAPVANVLVLPALPFIMIIGFILGIVGFVFLPLAGWIGYIVNGLVGWIMIVAEKLSGLPGASLEIGKIDVIWILIIYMILIWGIWLIKNRYGEK